MDEYDVDPDDFYETGRRSQIEDGTSGEESEGEKEQAPPRKCREGFRTAAVERDRAEEKSRARHEEQVDSSPLEGEIEYVVPLKGTAGSDNEALVVEDAQPQPPTEFMEISDDDSDALPAVEEELMDVPSPAQPSHKDKRKRFSPPPDLEEVGAASGSEDEEVLPHWKDMSKAQARLSPKENRPPAPLGKNKAKVVSLVSVAQKSKCGPSTSSRSSC